MLAYDCNGMGEMMADQIGFRTRPPLNLYSGALPTDISGAGIICVIICICILYVSKFKADHPASFSKTEAL